MVAAWNELAACPGDPGRLWLDCTVDALGPETAGRSAGLRAQRQRRGGLRRTPGRPARAAADGSTAGPLPSARSTAPGGPRWRPRSRACSSAAGSTLLTDLQALPGDVANLLQGFRLQSTLDIMATTRPERFFADHQLDVLELGETNPIALAAVGAGAVPAGRALRPDHSEAGEVTLERHGFTLRLGTATRLALERGITGPPGVSARYRRLRGQRCSPAPATRIGGRRCRAARRCRGWSARWWAARWPV